MDPEPKHRCARAPLRAPLLVAALASVLFLGTPAPASGHDIPPSVMVRCFVQVEGNVLRMVVRVPLNSMRDVEFPQRDPGYMLIAESEPLVRSAAQIWVIDYLRLFEEGRQLPAPEVLGIRVSLPSDVSFTSYEAALAHIESEPLPESTELPWTQALLDIALEFPIESEDSQFAIHSGLAHLGLETTTVLAFQLPGEEERVYQFTGDPGVVQLDPRWYQAAVWFVRMGFSHILEGIDHLLFLLCLVLPFRRVVPLVTLVTAFTVAHSITLGASALGFAPSALWFPPFVETLIALSIVLMAIENIVGAKLERRWIIAFGFGLVHGFGFSFALRESLQFAGAHLLTSLLAFNVGVELGQIAVVLVGIPILGWLFARVVEERLGIILLSALVLHSSWHWMADRWTALRAFPFQWPVFDLVFLLQAMRWITAALIAVAVGWGLHLVFERFKLMSGRESEVPQGS